MILSVVDFSSLVLEWVWAESIYYTSETFKKCILWRLRLLLLFFLHHMVHIFRGSQWSPVQRSVCCMLILKESLRSLPLRINGKSLQSLESVQKGVSTATEPPFPSVPLRLSLYFPPSLGVMCKCVVSSFQDLRSVTHVDVMIIITFMDTSKCFTYWTLFEPYIKAMSHKPS